ncbi:MAG: glutamate--tRNA ligase [Armatimonadota bacterium]|nr:glutamate--tRNA ligase [Armatimonadota bacterium]
MVDHREVRVRVAPSPTGDPHVGTAYIALFDYVFARHAGGKFVLRIEDTDRARSTRQSEEAILRALRWVGLQWDEGPDVGGPHGPYRQSERTEIYREHAHELVRRGHAYPCFCTPERLAELRRQQAAAKLDFGYDSRCASIPADEAARRMRSGEPFVIRLRVPDDGETVVYDRLRGAVAFKNALIDDQILLKSDGFPTYHLANVVDDHLMRISHVIRAEEWLSSTPKHLLLYRAFGWEAPEWIHMPLLRNADGSKISKRRQPTSIDYYRDIGILPEALRNFLALMGWALGGNREVFSTEEMIQHFSWEKVALGAPVFDLEKLAWLNGHYIRSLSPTQLLERLRAWRLGDEFLLDLIPLVRERIRRLDEFVPATSFFFTGDLGDLDPQALVPKNRTPGETAKLLQAVLEILDSERPDDTEALEARVREAAEAAGWKPRDLFMSLRVAVTGRTASPPLFDTVRVLGRELTRRRLRLAVAQLSAKK